MVLEHSLHPLSQAQPPRGSDLSLRSLEDFAKYYLLVCKVEQKSPKTISTYAERVNSFVLFTDKNADAITAYDIRLFLLSLQEKGLGANSIRAYYRALHSFFGWLIRENLLTAHPMATLKPPKVPKKLVRCLTIQNIKDVLAVSSSHHWTDIRNCALFLMFLDTGLRLDEMSTIQMSQVDLENGSILVMGKGAKERRVRLGSVTHKALLRYWISRKDILLPCLWITEEKTPMHRNGVQMAIRRMLRNAGCEGVKIGPHTLRHTAAMSYLRNGGDLATLQVMLGHADISTTKIYLSSLASEDMMKVHQRASPVDNLWK
jgi:site-specific recombinase XerD